MTISERLKECREKNGKTQEEIADILQITQQQYQLYESGKRKIPVDLLQILCSYYRISADHILGLKIPNNSCKKTEYGEIIKELRESKGLSQKDIATVLHTTQSYYSEYELGKRALPIQHLKTICILYGVSADYILGLSKGLKWPR